MPYANELHRKLTERLQAYARNPASGLVSDAGKLRTLALKMSSGDYTLNEAGEPTPRSLATFEDDVHFYRTTQPYAFNNGQPPEEPDAAPVVAAPRPRPAPGRPQTLLARGTAHLEEGNAINDAAHAKAKSIADERVKRELRGE